MVRAQFGGMHGVQQAFIYGVASEGKQGW